MIVLIQIYHCRGIKESPINIESEWQNDQFTNKLGMVVGFEI
jgi:hypothetical protein